MRITSSSVCLQYKSHHAPRGVVSWNQYENWNVASPAPLFPQDESHDSTSGSPTRRSSCSLGPDRRIVCSSSAMTLDEVASASLPITRYSLANNSRCRSACAMVLACSATLRSGTVEGCATALSSRTCLRTKQTLSTPSAKPVKSNRFPEIEQVQACEPAISKAPERSPA